MSDEALHPIMRDMIYNALRTGHDAYSLVEKYELYVRDLIDQGQPKKGALTAYPQAGIIVNLKHKGPTLACYVTPKSGEPIGYAEFFTPYDTDDGGDAVIDDFGTRWFAALHGHVFYFGARAGDCITLADISRHFPEVKGVPIDDMIWMRDGYFYDPNEILFKKALGALNVNP